MGDTQAAITARNWTPHPVKAGDGKLDVGAGYLPSLHLLPVAGDRFSEDDLQLTFSRDSQKRADGFPLTAGRVRDIPACGGKYALSGTLLEEPLAPGIRQSLDPLHGLRKTLRDTVAAFDAPGSDTTRHMQVRRFA